MLMSMLVREVEVAKSALTGRATLTHIWPRDKAGRNLKDGFSYR